MRSENTKKQVWPLVIIVMGVLCASVYAGGGSSQTTKGDASSSGQVADPITTSIGEYFFSKPLFTSNLRFTLYYASRIEKYPASHNDPFGGSGFTHNYHIGVHLLGEDLVVLMPQGNTLWFVKQEGGWQITDEEVIYQLRETDDYYYLADPIREVVYTFEKTVAMYGSAQVGALIRIEDRHGNALTITNQQDEAYVMPVRIEDGLGRSLTFTYEDPSEFWRWPHLSEVVDDAGRTIRFEYEVTMDENSEMLLKSVTDVMGQTTWFDYTGSPNNRVVASQTKPEGNVPFTQTYEREPMPWGEPEWWPWRAVTQTDAYGQTTTLSFDDVNGVTEVTDPNGVVTVHQHEGQRLLTQWTDANQAVIQQGYDEAGRKTDFVDRMAGHTQIDYHAASGKVARYVDAMGGVTTYDYVEQAQAFTNPVNQEAVSFRFYPMERVTFADGTTNTFAYNDQGSITTFTDEIQHTWQYAYNARGQLIQETLPTGGSQEYAYGPDGSLVEYHDSDKMEARYQYDSYRRVTRIEHKDGSYVEMAYNLNNALTSVTDELGRTAFFAYDENGHLTKVTDRLGREREFGYDLLDRNISRTDAMGRALVFDYDHNSQPKSVDTPTGARWRYRHNAQGWLTHMTNALDQTWRTTYDAEGMPTSVVSPMGLETRYTSNALGPDNVFDHTPGPHCDTRVRRYAAFDFCNQCSGPHHHI